MILSLVPNSSDADDLLQETSIRMWQKFSEFQPGTDFGAWGLRFARFTALNFLKTRRRAGMIAFDDDLLEALADVVGETAAQIDPRYQILLTCVDKLPQRAREMIELRYEPGATGKTVATRLGKSVESVYKALSRIHSALVQCVEQALAREARA